MTDLVEDKRMEDDDDKPIAIIETSADEAGREVKNKLDGIMNQFMPGFDFKAKPAGGAAQSALEMLKAEPLKTDESKKSPSRH